MYKPQRPTLSAIENLFNITISRFLSGFANSGQAKPDTTDVPLSMANFERDLSSFLIETYNIFQHIETDKAPQTLWRTGDRQLRLPHSSDQLNQLLISVPKPHYVHRRGIHFLNLFYHNPLLRQHVGELVEIKYDPHNIAEITVYQQNTLICQAQCEGLKGQTISIYELDDRRSRIYY